MSNQVDGVHDSYDIEVVDNNGISYEWNDTDIVADATELQIKTAISDYLKTIYKMIPPPVKTQVDAAIVSGTKLSDIT